MTNSEKLASFMAFWKAADAVRADNGLPDLVYAEAHDLWRMALDTNLDRATIARETAIDEERALTIEAEYPRPGKPFRPLYRGHANYFGNR